MPTLSFQQSADTFRVTEELFFQPSGSGDHVFVFIEKKGISTAAAKRMLSEQLGVPIDHIKHAGKKDRDATARQWLSYPRIPAIREPSDHPQLRILDLQYHAHGLSLGHVRLNHFELTLGGPIDDQPLNAEFKFPNFYGGQRFGRFDPANLDNPKPWVERARRDAFSQVQATFFNLYLQWRLKESPHFVEGDIYGFPNSKKTFWSSSDTTLKSRLETGEIVPTGPMFGAKMACPEHDLEQQFLSRYGLSPADFVRRGKSGQGSRRLLWSQTWELTCQNDHGNTHLSFKLRSGCYATVVLMAIFRAKCLSDPFWQWPNFSENQWLHPPSVT